MTVAWSQCRPRFRAQSLRRPTPRQASDPLDYRSRLPRRLPELPSSELMLGSQNPGAPFTSYSRGATKDKVKGTDKQLQGRGLGGPWEQEALTPGAGVHPLQHVH